MIPDPTKSEMRCGGQKRQERKTSRVSVHGQGHPGGIDNPDSSPGEDTGPIPAVGIPEKYKKECSWGDVPIYCCFHCRQNGTFDPKKYNLLSASELLATQAPPKPLRSEKSLVTGPFLSDFEIRRILEGMGIKDRDPVNDAFQHNRFGKGSHTQYTRSELDPRMDRTE
jgi:hypothetical protein